MCSSLASGFRFARRGRPSKISSTTSAPEPIIGGARSDSPVSTRTDDTYREPHHGIRRYPTTYVPIVHTQDRRDSDTVSMPWQACGVEPPDVCAMDHGPVLPRRSAFAGREWKRNQRGKDGGDGPSARRMSFLPRTIPFTKIPVGWWWIVRGQVRLLS